MQEFILKILKEIELDKEYIKLCQNYCDLDNSANFNKKEVESIIKSFIELDISSMIISSFWGEQIINIS